MTFLTSTALLQTIPLVVTTTHRKTTKVCVCFEIDRFRLIDRFRFLDLTDSGSRIFFLRADLEPVGEMPDPDEDDDDEDDLDPEEMPAHEDDTDEEEEITTSE
jgi:hypothetical protein